MIPCKYYYIEVLNWFATGEHKGRDEAIGSIGAIDALVSAKSFIAAKRKIARLDKAALKMKFRAEPGHAIVSAYSRITRGATGKPLAVTFGLDKAEAMARENTALIVAMRREVTEAGRAYGWLKTMRDRLGASVDAARNIKAPDTTACLESLLDYTRDSLSRIAGASGYGARGNAYGWALAAAKNHDEFANRCVRERYEAK